MVIVPRARDLGGFEVRRALPSARRQMVGPFIFWDQMGPAVFLPGPGMDVRPHPHIGLATVTYLFEGEIVHRDSLGTVQTIRPGEVNWMTAGRGIVHSERTAPRRLGEDRSCSASRAGSPCRGRRGRGSGFRSFRRGRAAGARRRWATVLIAGVAVRPAVTGQRRRMVYADIQLAGAQSSV